MFENTIIISDYDGGYYRSIYKDGILYKDIGHMLDIARIPSDVLRIMECYARSNDFNNLQKYLNTSKYYGIIICAEGDITILENENKK